jgi:hypothetical protein
MTHIHSSIHQFSEHPALHIIEGNNQMSVLTANDRAQLAGFDVPCTAPGCPCGILRAGLGMVLHQSSKDLGRERLAKLLLDTVQFFAPLTRSGITGRDILAAIGGTASDLARSASPKTSEQDTEASEDTTPAQDLRAAAKVLRTSYAVLKAEAEPSNGQVVWFPKEDWNERIPTEAQADWISHFTPEVAEPLADLLDSIAKGQEAVTKFAERLGLQASEIDKFSPPAVTAARAILQARR